MPLSHAATISADPAAVELLSRGEDLFRMVGNTDMVEIPVFRDLFPNARILAKAEYLNPGGSLKDRPVVRILQDAILNGELRKGMTILDSSSGNAGIAYALFGRALGFDVELVVPGNASRERLQRIRAHGARLVLTDPLEGYDYALRECHRLYHENPAKYFHANQYANASNWRAHYDGTAEEILLQAPDITHFVAGVGTGGSITGIGRKLRRHMARITIVGVRPDRFPGVEGLKPLGEPQDIVPEIFDPAVVDEWVSVSADEAHENCHRLAGCGFFVGQSSGAYMAAVGKVLSVYPSATVVTLLNDIGERYASTGLWD
jgi:cysteine synthase B